MLVPMLSLVGVGEVSLPSLQQWSHRAGIPISLASVLGCFAILNCLAAWAERQQDWKSHQLYVRFPQLLQIELYQAICEVDWLYFTTLRKGQLLYSCSNEFDRIRESLAGFYGIILRTSFLIAHLVTALILAPGMALISACFGLVVLAITRTKTYQAYKTGQEISEDLSAYYQLISNHFDGFAVARCYGVQERHTQEFLARVEGVLNRQLHGQKIYFDSRFLARCSSVLLLGGLCYAGLEHFQATSANLLIFIFIFSRIVPALSELEQVVQSFLLEASSYQNVMALTRECRLHAVAMSSPQDTDLDTHLSPSVEFCNVSLIYPGSSEPSLANVSIRLEPGQHAAIVGPSGAGKSTLVDLMLGLLTPTEGEIKVGGRTLDAGILASWRQQVAYVPQETFLFPDTIRSNLLWARPGATDEQLWRALSLARADQFVKSLDEGLGTVLGERGTRLSGGERQRVALARAFLREPKMLILDEATSALDLENERQILENLQGLEMTLAVVTHRTNCLELFPRRFSVFNGRVSENFLEAEVG